MINFFSRKKKFRQTSQNGRVPILRPNLSPISEIENFFFSKFNLLVVFWGEIYQELPCRYNHYIIISWSRSKLEKTMKNSDFSNFDYDPEIMLKWLQHHGNLQWIPPQKTLWSTFFSKKKNSVRHPKIVVIAILRPYLRPFPGIDNFFFSKFNLLIQFFGEKFAGNYHVVGIITQLFRDHGRKSKKRWKIRIFRFLTVIPG